MIEHYFHKCSGWFGFRLQYEHMIDILPNNACWVEVGSYQGRSLSWLLVEAHNRGCKFDIHSVDIWGSDNASSADEKSKNKIYNNFIRNTSPFHGQFQIHRTLSWDAAHKFSNGSVDYVMIDAAHDYDSVKKDIEAWWPKISSGGYMGGDDFNSDETNGVAIAVLEFVKQHNLQIRYWPNLKPAGNKSRKVKNWLVQKHDTV